MFIFVSRDLFTLPTTPFLTPQRRRKRDDPVVQMFGLIISVVCVKLVLIAYGSILLTLTLPTPSQPTTLTPHAILLVYEYRLKISRKEKL